MVNTLKSLLLVVLQVLLAVVVASSLSAQELTKGVTQSSFATPVEAVQALVAAVRDNDDNRLAAIFGPEADKLISSGDSVADHKGRDRFLKSYAENNSLEIQNDRLMVLQIGSGEYPFPIPLVRGDGGWYFDTAAGMEEILNRRIGRNELHTIEVLRAYAAAQREYACRSRQDGAPAQFAQRLISSAGKQDGLYWPAGEDEDESPFGPLIAEATESGYDGTIGTGASEPFHGYYFRILTAQGTHADGGAFDYLVNGRMVLGFGMVAYPASYGSTGVKTFIVNQEGVIYEKDLDDKTAKAAAMTTYDPDESWRKTVEPPE